MADTAPFHTADLNQRLRTEQENSSPLSAENVPIFGVRPHILPRVLRVRTAKPVLHPRTEHATQFQFRYNEPLVLKCNVRTGEAQRRTAGSFQLADVYVTVSGN